MTNSLITETPEYKQLVTFELCKRRPVYNWFYYKEGFAPELVWELLERFGVPKGATVLDPFCGTGTSLLAAAQHGYNAVGFDITPLAVFVSNTKLHRGYDLKLLKEEIDKLSLLKFGETKLKWPDLGFIEIRKAFSRYARNDLLFFKEKILEVKDEKVRNFLFLGLLSIVMESSNVKRDGGVLRVVKKRHLPPVRKLLRNRLKRMYKDLVKAGEFPGETNANTGEFPDGGKAGEFPDGGKVNEFPGEIHAEARLGDSRNLPLEKDSVEFCITSPPYLNWVDYTKIYALEMALLMDGEEIRRARSDSLRSYIGAKEPKDFRVESEQLDELFGKLEGLPESSKPPAIMRGYFEDLFMNLESIYNSLKPDGRAAIVIGNSCLPNLDINSDLILAEMAQGIGFEAEGVWSSNTRICKFPGMRDSRPVRESIVIIKK